MASTVAMMPKIMPITLAGSSDILCTCDAFGQRSFKARMGGDYEVDGP